MFDQIIVYEILLLRAAFDELNKFVHTGLMNSDSWLLA